MFTRLKAAWRVLTGKVYIPKVPQMIYVKSGLPDNQFVQLLAWQGSVLALDAEGKIWELRPDSVYGFTTQLIQESPRSYR